MDLNNNIYISPKAHIITDNHINIDKEKINIQVLPVKELVLVIQIKLEKELAKDIPELKGYLWDGY